MKPQDERPNRRIADMLTALKKRGGQTTRRKSNEANRLGEAFREGSTSKKRSGTLQRQVSAIAKKVNGKQVAQSADAEKQAAAARRRARRIKRLKAACENPTNTPVTSYNRGCRCKACVAAHSDYMVRYMRERRKRIQPSSESRKADVERTKAWRKANPERYMALIKQASARRRARLYATGTLDEALIDTILRACLPGMEVDHIVPLASGGAHHPQNLQYLEARQNKRKGVKRSFTPPPESVCRWQDVPLLVSAYMPRNADRRGR
jgi:5-methylcytosine-specific restriction endonuclease McrA